MRATGELAAFGCHKTRQFCSTCFKRSHMSFHPARDPLPDHEQKQAALSYLNEAWAEARHDSRF